MMQPNRHHKNRDPFGKETRVKEPHNVLSPGISDQSSKFILSLLQLAGALADIRTILIHQIS